MSELSLPFAGKPSPNGAFGYRKIVLDGKVINHFHDGTDWPVGFGTPLRAMGDGKVAFITYTALRGHQIGIEHPNGDMSGFNLVRYKPPFTKGQAVKKGQVIAYSGPHIGWEKSGAAANGPHCHAWLKTGPLGVFTDMMKVLTYNFDAPESSGGESIEEEDMKADEREWLKFLYDAHLNGGPDMPDGGRSIGESLAGIVDVVDEIKALVQPLMVERNKNSNATLLPEDGSNLRHTKLQDDADTNTIARRLVAQLGALEAIVAKIGSGVGVDPKIISKAAREGAEAALADLVLKAG